MHGCPRCQHPTLPPAVQPSSYRFCARCGLNFAPDDARAITTNGGSTMPDQTFMTAYGREAMTREAGIAFLVKDGPHLLVPCSRYGRDAEDCAPVAWRVAEIIADESGEPIAEDDLDYAMGLVVNDSDDVESLLREHGTPGDLELLPGVEEDDTSEDPCTEHGFDVCPDCGNGGIKIDTGGYVPCTRFLTCWADLDDGTEG
jgi:hypothetical protein